MATDTQQWLDSLKAGDDVAVFDYKGSIFRHTTKVDKRTPSGRIICTSEDSAFNSDGYQIGSKSDRCLRPVAQ
jgi:hypothetical protein